MFIIFGAKRGGAEDLGATIPMACPNCKNEVFFHLAKSCGKATLFFVPILTYNTQYFMVCEGCNFAFEIDNEKAMCALDLIPTTTAFREQRLPREEYVKQLQNSELHKRFAT